MEEKPIGDILASLMNIIENPELRDLIQKILEDDKNKVEAPVQMKN